MNTDLDFLCVGAHADDVELGMGGTVAKLVRLGKRGAILDLSDASMGTRGTVEERTREALEAARILGVPRSNLGFRDGFLDSRDPALRTRLTEYVRRVRPAVVFTHPLRDRHPDHEQTAQLVRDMTFLSGLAKYPSDEVAFRPSRVFHWMGARDGDPDFCVDVSQDWETRQKAIAAFGSQFGAEGPTTPLSGQSFRDFLEARGRFLGSRIRAKMAEGFYCDELPEIFDPTTLCKGDF